MKVIFSFLAIMTVFGCSFSPVQNTASKGEKRSFAELSVDENLKSATFAGGCFWCMEGVFEAEHGVIEAISGYAGGTEADAQYEKVGMGKTLHREAVRIFYNPEQVSYERLLEIFWRQIDPVDAGGQFADRGFQYTTAIFVADDIKKTAAEKSKTDLENSGKFDAPIATKIVPLTTFFPAEPDHQDFYLHAAERYKQYKKGSGREDFLHENWGEFEKPSEKILREKLTPLQYNVTQEEGTEAPFQNAYWNEHRDGIYVDIVSNEPLFSSRDKYDSGTGWPSFVKPLEPDNIKTNEDTSLFTARTEIRSAYGDSHLGHVFPDGPADRGGMRYCMNSAALRFIPREDLKKEGHGEYEKLFEE